MQDVAELIAHNETVKALDALKDLLKEKGRSDLMKTVINQSAAFMQAREFHANDLIDFKEFREAQSKVHYALLTVLEQLGQSADTPSEKSAPPPRVHIENSKNVVAGTVTVNTQGGDFIIGDK
jgi:hypothetical protein